MRIIIACNARNKYIDQLAHSLSHHQNVESAVDSLFEFWRRSSPADVIHIQWPEALYHWKDPRPWELARLDEVLDEWKSRAKIVTTIHNFKPHHIDDYQPLYRMVYEKSDGFVHLGSASRDWFFNEYEFASQKYHAVIPHGNYTCFPNDVTRAEARSRLGLNPEDYVCLCFGEVRYHEERDLLIEAFDQLGVPRKNLVIAGRLPPLSRRTFRYWRIKWDPRLHVYEDWIPDEEVQVYLNAADVVVIPRQGVLNSGDVALGFTFGRVVVGPDEGVIGEVLNDTRNPTYEPGNPRMLTEALQEANELREEIADQNHRHALKQMGWEKVASHHAEFYDRILGSRWE